MTDVPDDEMQLFEQIRRGSVRTKKSRLFERLRAVPSAEVQDLMRLAIERPQAFCKIFD